MDFSALLLCFALICGDANLLIDHITGSSTIWRRRLPQWFLLFLRLETGSRQTMPFNL